jgi:hypothetical protein
MDFCANGLVSLQTTMTVAALVQEKATGWLIVAGGAPYQVR